MSLLFDAEAAAEQLRTAEDAELLERSRRGDSFAFAELFRRYRRLAMVVASRTSSSLDPEDVSAEAFTRVWQALRNGGGPATAFRPYLSTSVRNVALNWHRGTREVPVEPTSLDDTLEVGDETEVAIAEAELIGRAFRGLPARWQEALWASEVEGVSTTDLAARLGMSNNATAALCMRAREGLRNAWLAEHIDRRSAVPECRWVLEHLSGYSRRRLPEAQHQRVAIHLAECRRCRTAASRLDRVVAVLRISLLAAGATAGLLAAGTVTGGAGGGAAVAATMQPSTWLRRLARTLLQPQVGLAVVIAAVAVTSLGLGAHGEPIASAAGREPSPATTPIRPGTVAPAPEPSVTASAAAVSTEPDPHPSAEPTATSSPKPSPTNGARAKPSPRPEPTPSDEPYPPFGSWPTPSIEPSPSTEPTPSDEPYPPLGSWPTPSTEPTPSDEPSATPSSPESPTTLSGRPSPSAMTEIDPGPSTTAGPTEPTPTDSADPTVSASPFTPPDETATPQPSPTPSCVLIWDFFLHIGVCRT